MVNNMPTPPITWKREETITDREVWTTDGYYSTTGGYVSQYIGTNNYYWHDARRGHKLSGIETGVDAAMAACEAAMALPDDEFNNRVAAELKESLKRIEAQLLELQPDTALLPGYHTGFEAGYAKARDAVLAVLVS